MKIVRCDYCDGTGLVLDADEEASHSIATRHAPTMADLLPALVPTPVAEPSMAELPPPLPLEPSQAASGPENRPAPPPGTCSQGHPWKTVPAGVSQKTGNSYAAFTVCVERSHEERFRR